MIWRNTDPRASFGRKAGGLAFLAAPLFLMVAACSPEPISGIEGESVIGPTRPVARIGEQQPDQVPYPVTLLILAAADRRPVARVVTGPDGRFRIDLPPGDYRVTVPSPSERILPHAPEEQVRVVTANVTHVTIRFGSGLR